MAVPLPARIHLELTNRCNSACRTCIRLVRKEPRHEMHPDDAVRLLDELPDLRHVTLHVTGEPLLYRHLRVVLRRLRQRRVAVALPTNGVALSVRRATEIVAEAVARITIVLDGASPETYRMMRGVHAFERVIGNVSRLLLVRGPAVDAPRVALGLHVTNGNLAELPALVALAARLRVEEVELLPLWPFGAGVATDANSPHARLADVDFGVLARAEAVARECGVAIVATGGRSPLEMLAPPSPSPPAPCAPCAQPSEGAVVMSNGDVVACAPATHRGDRAATRLGNVLSDGWPAVWDGAPYGRLRDGHRSGAVPSYCDGCGVRWSR